MLVILVLGSLTLTGYYVGKKSGTNNKIEVKDKEVNLEPSPTATNIQKSTTIVAGISKSAGLSFDQYSIVVPDGWASKKESQTALDEKLILEKNGYIISIFQAATGGALCLYPGDADFEGPSSKFESYIALNTMDDRTLRRSGNKNETSFTICQKSPDGSFQQPTNYGHISIKAATNPTIEMLSEIDTIISSLNKI